ncbi:MAG: magnesium transporter CorA family protein [Bacteroidales bacterium]|nr:magnesium transporter CorA family protein [Bacteroidales bacterium]
MRTYLYAENGFVEKSEWSPNCWINVEVPTEEDIHFLTSDLKVPESFLTDIEDIDERPRIELEDGWMLTILRIPLRSDENGIPFITIPLGIITKGDIFVTVCHFNTEVLPDLIRYSQRKNIQVSNSINMTLRLLYSSSVWFLKYLKQLNNQMRMAELELERSIRNEDLHRLMKIEKSMVFFNTSIRGNEVMLSKFRSIIHQAKEVDLDLLEDVQIELKQAYITANIYSDILAGTMDAFASIISNNVNIIMKRMTSISIILMVPTLIASFYGMNVFTGLEGNTHAFIAIIIVSVLFSASAFYVFRKIKWF